MRSKLLRNIRAGELVIVRDLTTYPTRTLTIEATADAVETSPKPLHGRAYVARAQLGACADPRIGARVIGEHYARKV